MASEKETIEAFVEAGPFAVAGASTNRDKYGNKVLRCFQQNSKAPLYPLNPRADEIEGLPCYPNLEALPSVPRSLSIITPPKITRQVVQEAIAAGVQYLWMQPGAEDDEAIAAAEQAGLGVIAHGACLLVVLGYRE
jgi:predicted CoA-binding protein